MTFLRKRYRLCSSKRKDGGRRPGHNERPGDQWRLATTPYRARLEAILRQLRRQSPTDYRLMAKEPWMPSVKPCTSHTSSYSTATPAWRMTGEHLQGSTNVPGAGEDSGASGRKREVYGVNDYIDSESHWPVMATSTIDIKSKPRFGQCAEYAV